MLLIIPPNASLHIQSYVIEVQLLADVSRIITVRRYQGQTFGPDRGMSDAMEGTPPKGDGDWDTFCKIK